MTMKRRPSARVRANRQNALRSTGPKTTAGKARSSRNALVHGLSAAPHVFDIVETLAKWIAEGDGGPEMLQQARAISQADLTARLARRLRAMAIDRLVNDNIVNSSLIDNVAIAKGDTSAILAPETRAHISSAEPAELRELRPEATIARFATRLDKMGSAQVNRCILRLDLYEMRALGLRKRAIHEFRAASDPRKV